MDDGTVDRGEWLNTRLVINGRDAVVVISREALEDHFNAHAADGGLVTAFRANEQRIHDVASQRAVAGADYTLADPLVLQSADF